MDIQVTLFFAFVPAAAGPNVHLFTSKQEKMKAMVFLKIIRKWLRRLAISYMLGFASAIDHDTKSMDDFSVKTEQENPI